MAVQLRYQIQQLCAVFSIAVSLLISICLSNGDGLEKIEINISTSPSSLTGIFFGWRMAETRCESQQQSNNLINENALRGLKCHLLQLMKNVLGVNNVWSGCLPTESGLEKRESGLNNQSRRRCSSEKERGMSNVCKWGLLFSGETRWFVLLNSNMHVTVSALAGRMWSCLPGGCRYSF